MLNIRRCLFQLDNVLRERQDELRSQQQRELEKMREDHGRSVRQLQDEFKEKVRGEVKILFFFLMFYQLFSVQHSCSGVVY